MKRSHSILGKLLAEENFKIIIGDFETASFDVEDRVLRMPNWEMRDETLTMLTAHEVGHTLFTPNNSWQELSEKHPNIHPSMFNILEDVRIEQMMIDKFPGLARDFRLGYAEFIDMDFFKISGENVDKMSFPNRINIKAKLRDHIDVAFSKTETEFLERLGKMKTFEDMVELTVELHSMCTMKRLIDEETSDGEFADEFGESLEDALGKILADGEENGDFEKSEVKRGPSPSGAGSDEHIDIGQQEGDPLDTSSYDTMAKSMKKTRSMRKTLRAPSLEECMDCIYTYEDVKSSRGSSVRPKLKNADAKKEVNHLVREFEMRMSAAATRRARVSQKGSLDVKKLHRYKYDDNLFQQVTTVPDGKNHGMVMLIDFSYSMSNIISKVCYQSGMLAMFCRRMGIPFVIYGFTTGHSKCYGTRNSSKESEICIMPKMFELSRSDLPKNDLDESINVLLNYPYSPPSKIEFMSGTPLGESYIIVAKMISHLRKKWKAEKMSFISLTDGSGGLISTNVKSFDMNMIIDDRIVPIEGWSGAYSDIVEYIRSTGVDTLGIHFEYRASGYTKHVGNWNRDNMMVAKNYGGFDSHILMKNNMAVTPDFDAIDVDAKATIKSQFKKIARSKINGRALFKNIAETLA